MSFVSSLAKASFPSSGQWYGNQGKVQVRKTGPQQDQGFRQQQGGYNSPWHAGHSYNITCKWEPFREQILTQWDRLTGREVDAIGPHRSRLALLIESKYGIAAHLVENYLRNFERTLPLI
jgi:hypothetical protein